MDKSASCSNRNRSAFMYPCVFLLFMSTFAGCSVNFLNVKPAQELKAPQAPAANLYSGWRVFQDKCSSCHGSAATGSDKAPNLLPIVKEMNARQFAELVLKRYDLSSGVPSGLQDRTTFEARIEEILRGAEPAIEMPAWQGEPSVNAHILDLYGYLSARVEGKFGADRPKN
jgi:hypothetical protein